MPMRHGRAATEDDARDAQVSRRHRAGGRSGARQGRVGEGTSRAALGLVVLADGLCLALQSGESHAEPAVLLVTPAHVARPAPPVRPQAVEAAVIADAERRVALDRVATELTQRGPAGQHARPRRDHRGDCVAALVERQGERRGQQRSTQPQVRGRGRSRVGRRSSGSRGVDRTCHRCYLGAVYAPGVLGMTLPEWFNPDNLRTIAIVVVVAMFVLWFLVMRFVQKLVMKAVFTLLLTLVAFGAWHERADLGDSREDVRVQGARLRRAHPPGPAPGQPLPRRHRLTFGTARVHRTSEAVRSRLVMAATAAGWQ